MFDEVSPLSSPGAVFRLFRPPGLPRFEEVSPFSYPGAVFELQGRRSEKLHQISPGEVRGPMLGGFAWVSLSMAHSLGGYPSQAPGRIPNLAFDSPVKPPASGARRITKEIARLTKKKVAKSVMDLAEDLQKHIDNYRKVVQIVLGLGNAKLCLAELCRSVQWRCRAIPPRPQGEFHRRPQGEGPHAAPAFCGTRITRFAAS